MEELIGRTLGHYGIVEKIGAGGMGVVFRAHDVHLDRDVAIKVLPEEVAGDSDRLHRFEREAKALAALNHPNIATVFGFESFEIDAGAGVTPAQAETVHVLVMELLEGESLRSVISKPGLATSKAVEYARAIADGLSAAHEKVIIHRDLKPENVFLTKDGRIKILDFGLAKLKLPEADLTTETPTETLDTSPGAVMGTVAYMAPEQVQGQKADHRSDIFAFGVVLYEMLSGRRPFGGSTTVETAAAILKEDPEPIAVVSPAIAPALATVVAKCLEKRPEDRFSSAHDLSLTLAALDSVSAAPPFDEHSIISRRWPHILAVVIAAVIALLVILPPEALFERGGDGPGGISLPRIVVLPFENLGSPDDEFFADGMTEEIISRLAAVSGLQVISRTSAMQYKDTDKGIRQIGEELDVQYALEGTVRWERAGEGHGRVRITPQLIKIKDDSHLWSDRYDRGTESVFEVQSEIAMKVVDQLRVNLFEPEADILASRLTDNPEAYEAYLRCRYLATTTDLDQNRLSVKLCERAVELDPGFTLAWAFLAERRARLYSAGHDMSPERLAAARQAAERALALDPASPEGHRALGYFHYYCVRNHDRALEEFAKALAIRPNDTDALKGRAYILRRQGRWEESSSLLERVLDVSPRDFNGAYNLSLNLTYLRDFQPAERYADIAISVKPDHRDGYVYKIGSLFVQGRFGDARAVWETMPVSSWFSRRDLDFAERRFEEALATVRARSEKSGAEGAPGEEALDECACLFFLGDQHGVQEACGRAREALEAQTRDFPEYPVFHIWLGRAYAFLGHNDDAIREGERAVELKSVAEDAVDGPISVQNFAVILALVGESDAAIDQIEYLLSIPSQLSIGHLHAHPYWDPLRDHPRFQALLEKYHTEG